VSGTSAANGESRQVEIEGRTLTLTNLDRVLWPETGFTKGELIEYYRRVAVALLPHLRGRPLTLGRFPHGIQRPGFAQTECRGRPEWLPVRGVRTRGGELRRYCVVDDLASLLWVANQNAIELHTFLGRGGDLDSPSAVAFDLDPGVGTGLLECCRVAILLRELLAQLELGCFAKASGGAGLHVFVPLAGHRRYAATKAFARSVAEHLAGSHGRRVTARAQGEGRVGRVLIDWLQNSRMRTTVSAYSLRAADRPVVSAPVTWEEVERAVADARPELLVFGPNEVPARLERLGDPFEPVLSLRQRLPG
jgi:bifunctional non-homologous end joining protein LigD